MLLGFHIPNPYRPNPHYSILRRARAFATDPAVWRDLLYTLLLFPIGIAEFTIAVALVGLPLGLISVPFVAAFGGIYLVTMLVLWIGALPDYFGATAGRTSDGTPTGNGSASAGPACWPAEGPRSALSVPRCPPRCRRRVGSSAPSTRSGSSDTP